MKNIFTFVCGIFAVLALPSCISTNTVLVDFKEPAQITFPPEIVNLVVVDNTSLPEHTDSVKNLIEKGLLFSPDSAQINLSRYLAEYMDGENFFGTVGYYPNMRRGGDSVYTPLSSDEVREICSQTNADALISIDQCIIGGKVAPVGIFDYSELVISITAGLRTYLADGQPFSPILIYGDTLYWTGFLPSAGFPAQETLPDPLAAMDELVRVMADNLTNLYIPHWEASVRQFYSNSSSEMKRAARHVQKYEWVEAAGIWGNLFEKETKPLKKARLAFNIALANECLGDIDNALNWNRIATEQLAGQNTSAGLKKSVEGQNKILQARRGQVRKLKEQYGGE